MVIYLTIIFNIDASSGLFLKLLHCLNFIPTLIATTFFSFFLRYCRWYWLLYRAGNEFAFLSGFLPYLSGFALSATPGKAGELIRTRYFSILGVRATGVVSAFIFERVFDLVVVLLIASFAVFSTSYLYIAALFVTLIITFIFLAGSNSRLLSYFIANFRHYRFHRFARLGYILLVGLKGLKTWIKPLDLLICFLLGFFAWLSISLSFYWLLLGLNLNISFFPAISVYPLAMLVGAASMLPGGIGSTEATIAIQLDFYGATLNQATIAAVIVRFSTLWFAILCGLISILTLEYRFRSTNLK